VSGGLQDVRMFSSEGFSLPRGTSQSDKSIESFLQPGAFRRLYVHHNEIFTARYRQPGGRARNKKGTTGCNEGFVSTCFGTSLPQNTGDR
jgi:hypothetical protein